MSKLESGIKSIQEAFEDDFIEKLKTMTKKAYEDLEDKYCICNHHRNLHADEKGDKCEIEDCLCQQYCFSLVRSLFVDRDEFLQYHSHAMDYPHIKLLITLQYLGFNSDLFEILDNVFLWNGDPVTKPEQNDVSPQMSQEEQKP